MDYIIIWNINYIYTVIFLKRMVYYIGGGIYCEYIYVYMLLTRFMFKHNNNSF